MLLCYPHERPRLIFPCAYTIFRELEYLYLYLNLRDLRCPHGSLPLPIKKAAWAKTTTAVNLSACLATAEKKTLLLDIDPQANASSGCGIEVDEQTPCVYEVLLEDVPLMEVIHESDLSFSQYCALSHSPHRCRSGNGLCHIARTTPQKCPPESA